MTEISSSELVILTLHTNFAPFVDQLNNTFFLTLFLLPQDSLTNITNNRRSHSLIGHTKNAQDYIS